MLSDVIAARPTIRLTVMVQILDVVNSIYVGRDQIGQKPAAVTSVNTGELNARLFTHC